MEKRLKALHMYSRGENYLALADDQASHPMYHPVVLPVVLKMARYFGLDCRVSNNPQNDERLSCDEVAIMLDYLQKYFKPAAISDLRGAALSVRGKISEDNFERLGAIEYLDKAINYRRWAVLLSPPGDPRKPILLCDLATACSTRYSRLGELSDLDKGIVYFSQATRLTPEGDTNKLAFAERLGNAYGLRFRRLGEPSDIDMAIECQSQVLQLTPDGHAMQPLRIDTLGVLYQHRFECLGELSDADKAIACHNQVVHLTLDGDPEKPKRLNNLGGAHAFRFSRLGELSDIDLAVVYQDQAVLLTPEGDSEKPGWLSNLGVSLLCRFKYLGNFSDMDKAIACGNQAVQLVSDGHEGKPHFIHNLGTLYRGRFERLGDLSDIDKAIAYHNQAVQLIFDDDRMKPDWLGNLGNSHLARFVRLGGLEDVEQAIYCHEQAVRLIPDGHPGKPSLLNDLGTSHKCRFEKLGDLSDISKAVEHQTQAVLLTPDDHARLPGLLNNLGVSCLCRFHNLGELSDIDKAVAYQSKALELTPDNHAYRPILLNTLGESLLCRFLNLGDLLDLNDATIYHRRAVELIPDSHPIKPTLLNGLGASHEHMFRYLGKLLDIDEAILYHTQAAQLAPDGHPQKPMLLHDLGMSYLCRFERLGELLDIDTAVAYQRQAVQLAPDNHLNKSTLLDSLGYSHTCRFKRHGELSEINNAIECHSQAVQLIPEGRARCPRRIYNLGNSYNYRFSLLGEISDLQTAESFFKQAAQSTIGPSNTRFLAACSWARSSVSLDIPPLLAYQRALDLVPEFLWLGNTVEQRYVNAMDVGCVVSEAVSWAISVGQYDRALEWLEQGRSVVWNQILHIRTPLDDLASINPTLANRLKQVGHELGKSSSRLRAMTRSNGSQEQETQYHRRLAEEWDKLLKQAREIPGFNSLMRPLRADALLCAARLGPVIVINACESRCDALIVQPGHDKIAHVPLEHFSSQKAIDARAALADFVGGRGGRTGGFQRSNTSTSQARFKAMLAILWSDVVEPILKFLGYTHKLPIDELPHITWCTTGVLSSLPLHAAGCYDKSQPNAFDLVVSSYTPTLSALLAAPIAPVSGIRSGILAVGQENTKGFSNLPFTVHELAAIKEQAKAISYLQLDGGNATVDAVLKAMDEYSWVHFAGHATQDRTNPGWSAFHLCDGKLSLAAITNMSFKNKGLAFLSACQTATGAEDIPDEAVHLAAGMLMAGYPSVIATMWSIQDEDGPDIARDVYADLLKDGKMDCTGASRALHKAVAGIRRKVGEDSFERWVPFIHIGS